DRRGWRESANGWQFHLCGSYCDRRWHRVDPHRSDRATSIRANPGASAPVSGIRERRSAPNGRTKRKRRHTQVRVHRGISMFQISRTLGGTISHCVECTDVGDRTEFSLSCQTSPPFNLLEHTPQKQARRESILDRERLCCRITPTLSGWPL